MVWFGLVSTLERIRCKFLKLVFPDTIFIIGNGGKDGLKANLKYFLFESWSF